MLYLCSIKNPKNFTTMKKLYSQLTILARLMTVALACTVTFTSCLDEDEQIGYNVSGHWFGDMDMYFNGEPAQGSEIEFYTDWSYQHGTGVQVDYYAYHAVTTNFVWEVRDRILYLTFDDPALDCAIVDYRLNRDYFTGYIADIYTLENLTRFSLRNYDRYWEGYGYDHSEYYDYNPYTRAVASADSTQNASAAKPDGYHGIRGVNMHNAE